jgi:signal transduction histidine kinase/CheY-like chemotaxis protein
MAGERILVADDEPQIVRLCGLTLDQEGYIVHGVSSGRAAIAALQAEAFDVLVVDIRMPDVDGLTVLRQAHEVDPNLTAVVITGYATLDRTIEAMHAGARGFLLKPFGFEDLIAEVREALALRQKEEERLSLRAQLPILEISQALMTGGSVDTLAEQLLGIVARQIDSPLALLILQSAGEEELYVASTLGLPGEFALAGSLPVDPEIARRGRDASGPTLLDEHALSELEPTWQQLLAAAGLPSLLLAPLRTAGHEVGVLCLGREAPYTQSELRLLAIVGRQIAIALDNARLYAAEQQRAAELARTLEQQRELDRLKNEFIQNVSHELRTPLSLVMSYTEMLIAGDMGEVSAAQRGPLNTVWDCALILRDLVDNITALLDNQTRRVPQEPILLAELVEAALTAFAAPAQKAGLTLRAEVPEDALLVTGSGRHLRMVVDNLIGNALKFTPAGGSITVSLRRVEGQAVLQVADTGIGIDLEHQERIFERFFQVDGSMRRRYGGSGLGLALVKEIVETHGGIVAVKSEPGQGSTFEVILPTE